MTSRYDQPDTDPMDQWEEKPVDAADEPADGESWPEVWNRMKHGESLSTAIDPAEHAYHAAVDAFATLEVELAKCSDAKRAWVLRRLTQALDRRATDVMQAAASKLDDLVS